ncbi:hypothetical protein AMTRI_Chr04g180450 [Amborella trichopoda]|uniref:Protein BIG GRAIN 1-like A n=1 Tax=Amborella trichopoda TaxID=13333 RepID=W1PMH1_AMBTC|nr:protein BIG GRAIN 1-like B [Amborella trichopoda]ERN11197.1 hypothetical protein AMTR_s00024p00214860 [Amborella trichopoda]|eukprot:XP_006849616.1 protein BIG GRAIN 1-like B [Amborella trichopoda]
MDRWSYSEKLERESRHAHRNRNPSFSSALLDAIYKSTEEDQHLVFYKNAIKPHINQSFFEPANVHQSAVKRSHKAEKIVEKRVEKTKPRRKATQLGVFEAEHYYETLLYGRDHHNNISSSSDTSDSATNYGFSSSEAESAWSRRSDPSSRKSSKSPSTQFLGVSKEEVAEKKAIKSRASKLYGDFKKVKQPISPGNRLASFLNSLFSSAEKAKKAKLARVETDFRACENKPPPLPSSSTCSSASSYSRSCLSKTPSSRGKSGPNGVRRSVRFYMPEETAELTTSATVRRSVKFYVPGEAPELTESDAFRVPFHEKLKLHFMEKSQKVEAGKELFNEYQKKSEIIKEVIMRDFVDSRERELGLEEEEDDDTESCSSSDLFELENLAAVGIDRYQKELPVYETTDLGTNQAIAKGFLL